MNKVISILFVVLLVISSACTQSERLWVEAESFKNKGGWVVDQQFIDQMGSSYLMAHGMGKPVEDAETEISFDKTGVYYVYVRTYNWTSPWSESEGPGRFQLSLNGNVLPVELGATGNSWMWQSAGSIDIKQKKNKLSLHDLTGFNGRCDAIYFTMDANDVPASDCTALNRMRRQMLNLKDTPETIDKYDFVVVGGGIAGMSAAITAARLGCKVALVHDRPVLGGNNSSEVRVHLGGRIEAGPYTALGNLQKEFGPRKGGNAQPGSFYEDGKKMEAVKKEKNITLFASYRAFDAETEGNRITKIYIRNIETNKEMALSAPLFADCTGDANLGAMVNAEYRIGRESKAEFNEPTAPEKADKMTMGASVQWYSREDSGPSSFPEFKYHVGFNEESSEKVTMGEWTWETGMNKDQVEEAEYIRDYGLLVVYSNWSFLKNDYSKKEEYANRSLKWVAYIAGKRESRRLIGDHVLTENDLVDFVEYPDATGSTTWTIDLHYPDPANTLYFADKEFKSICKMKKIHPYPIPYRCLYSKNIENMFMAGRNISVTHVALGTVRVMRTTGILGEVVGMAASLCKKNEVYPRAIFPTYFEELKKLMEQGISKSDLPNNQMYNQGETLYKGQYEK